MIILYNFYYQIFSNFILIHHFLILNFLPKIMSIDFILIFNIHINFIFVKEFFNNLLDFIIFFSLIFK